MDTGPAPLDTTKTEVYEDVWKYCANPINFEVMSPWSQPDFMNLACMGEFVWPYPKNATCYGHEICTIKDWGLYVEALWQPHQIWSNEPLNSTIMCEFGWIRVVISPEPYNLWTWIQQRWMFINIILCGNSALELKSTMFHEFCFRGCVATIISSTLQPMDMRLVPLDTTNSAIQCIYVQWYLQNGIMFVKSAGFYYVGGGRMQFMKLSLNWKRVFTTRLTHKCTRLLMTCWL